MSSEVTVWASACGHRFLFIGLLYRIVPRSYGDECCGTAELRRYGTVRGTWYSSAVPPGR